MTKEESNIIYRVWHPTPPNEDFEENFTIHESNEKFVTLKEVKKLLGDNCRIAQNLPGTEYTMWCDEESKCKEDWQSKGNPGATQAWQDSAAHHSGWQWLTDHYGGFIWNHDFAVGNVVEIIKGGFEDDE